MKLIFILLGLVCGSVLSRTSYKFQENPVPTSGFCEGKENMFYPNPEDCTTFYKCTKNKGNPLRCPTQEPYFDPESLSCVTDPSVCSTSTKETTTSAKTTFTALPETTEPNDESQTTGGDDNTTQLPTSTTTDPIWTTTTWVSFCQGKENRLYPNPEDCRTYYKCTKNKGNPQPCPDKIPYFDPETLDCVSDPSVCVPVDLVCCV